MLYVGSMFTASKLSSLCYGFEHGSDWLGEWCRILCNEHSVLSNELMSARMSWGQQNESVAFERFALKSKLKVTEQEDTKYVAWNICGGGIATRSDGETTHAVLEIKSPFLKTYKEVPLYYIVQMMLEMIGYHKKKAYFIVHYTPHGWMKYVKYLHRNKMFGKIMELGKMYREGSNDEWERYLKDPSLYEKTPKKTSYDTFDIYQLDYSASLARSMKAFVACLNTFSFAYLRFVVQKPFLKMYYQVHLKKEMDALIQQMELMHQEIIRVRVGMTKVFKRSTRSRRSLRTLA